MINYACSVTFDRKEDAMTNLEKLRGVIAERGVLKRYLAERIGITPQAFSAKLAGKREFTMSEAGLLRTTLGLTGDEFMAIFFADDVA